MKVLITGSNGLVGSQLVHGLEQEGHTAIRLTRSSTAAASTIVLWNPDAKEIIKNDALEGMDAVVHLAGENIASGRWTAQKKASIRNSRVQGTGLLARTLASLEHKPEVFISASAVGFYGDRGNEELDEQSKVGSLFLSSVCRDWEAATHEAKEAGIRTVLLRIGMVLSKEGGALQKMTPPFRAGLGGPMGNGKQWMSWISDDDLVGIIRFIIQNKGITGPVNAVAPNPVQNRIFSKALGRVLHRPAFLPVPAFVLRPMLGEMADELILSSAKVMPRVLQEQGYIYQHPDLEPALALACNGSGKPKG